jgi:hypothetical protein
MREIENAQTTRVLRDDELDAVSGGYYLENSWLSFRSESQRLVHIPDGTSNTMSIG